MSVGFWWASIKWGVRGGRRLRRQGWGGAGTMRKVELRECSGVKLAVCSNSREDARGGGVRGVV